MIMKKYTDLFIDFDDTLYDTYGNAVVALRELYEYCNFGAYFSSPDIFYEAYWKANVELWGQYAKGEITRDQLIIERFRRPLSQGKGINPTEKYCLEVSDKFLDLCSCKPGVVAGAHEAMDYLQSKGYRMHICSNGFREVQYKKLKASGLMKYFETIILSEEAGYNKPSPLFFEYAIQKSGAPKQSVLMIGDNLDTDVRGAENVGIDTVFFNRYDDFRASDYHGIEIRALRELMDIL